MAELKEVRRDAHTGEEIIHEYDGILEADNHLPTWWLGVFFGTVIFGVLYWFYYQVYEVSPGLYAQYQQESAEAAAARGVALTPDQIVANSKDPSVIAEGQKIFTTNCVSCHLAHGEGNIGPNLTDDAWIHGGGAGDIRHTITAGVGAKGMPAWGSVLGLHGVDAVTSYVLTLRGTNVAGKAAEGNPWNGSEAESSPNL